MSGNDLGAAASPYLLQHAHNPVHWRMWGDRALAEAQAAQKPILLSVGYAACHWCHVMAHESFEDPATAAVMNELFVNIKVDREERPDIDHIYMSALHSFGERGGWPLTMFLTPTGDPFWGGTYFPKSESYGRPSFVSVLRSVAHAFRSHPEKIAYNTDAVRKNLEARASADEGVKPLSLSQLDSLAPQVLGFMDEKDGGLRGAPKFPNTPILEFLWRAGGRLGEPIYRERVSHTLERMSEGGIYDHLGGGYARYATDERWLVPHFEKMLYDNAQILEMLAVCFAQTGDLLFRKRAEETVGWLMREMTSPDGSFFAAIDADSEGEEGKFYVWTYDEIVTALGAEDAAFFGAFYDAAPAGNWTEERHGHVVIILNRLASRRPTPEEETRLEPLKQKLFAHRETRVRPSLDDKIMADWNGLMIAALVHAATIFDEPDWVRLAATAYRFIVSTLRFADDGGRVRLAHAWRGGVLVTPALAFDHAAMISAALALHEARHFKGLGAILVRDYLADAEAWASDLITYHRMSETGLLSMSARDARDVILRLAPTTDDAIPNVHPVFLTALARLAVFSDDPSWRQEANRLFAATATAVQTNFIGHAGILNALDFHLRGREIVVAGTKRAPLYDAALAVPFWERIVVDLDNAEAMPETHPVRAQAVLAGEGAAFVCSAGACSLPIRDVSTLLQATAV